MSGDWHELLADAREKRLQDEANAKHWETAMTEQKHSPTPWRVYGPTVRDASIDVGSVSLSADGDYACQAWSAADAAHIVRCVNAYEGLVAVLNETIERASHEDGCRWWIANVIELITPEGRAANEAKCNCFISECRAALAKAKA